MSNNAEQPKVVPEDDDEPDDWYLVLLYSIWGDLES